MVAGFLGHFGTANIALAVRRFVGGILVVLQVRAVHGCANRLMADTAQQAVRTVIVRRIDIRVLVAGMVAGFSAIITDASVPAVSFRTPATGRLKFSQRGRTALASLTGILQLASFILEISLHMGMTRVIDLLQRRRRPHTREQHRKNQHPRYEVLRAFVHKHVPPVSNVSSRSSSSVLPRFSRSESAKIHLLF